MIVAILQVRLALEDAQLEAATDRIGTDTQRDRHLTYGGRLLPASPSSVPPA